MIYPINTHKCNESDKVTQINSFMEYSRTPLLTEYILMRYDLKIALNKKDTRGNKHIKK